MYVYKMSKIPIYSEKLTMFDSLVTKRHTMGVKVFIINFLI